MLINFNTINYYYLTCDTNSERAKHIREEFKDYNITEINPVMSLSKFQSGATGHLRMLDLGLRNQDRSKPFEPFILLEDDVSMYRDIPNIIEIPDDTDILYVGFSPWGIKNNNKEPTEAAGREVYYTNIDDNNVKIYNMLSTHGLMICSPLGAHAYQKAVIESFHKNRPYDLHIASLQPYYNIYMLKNPLVFQDPKFGGQLCTKNEVEKCSHFINKKIPDEYVYKNTIPIKTCQFPKLN